MHLAISRGLEDVERLGDRVGSHRAVAEFAHGAPVLELGVGPLAGGHAVRVGGVGGFQGGRLVPAPVQGKDVLASADVGVIRGRD